MFDDPETQGDRPQLNNLQLDLLARGRAAYTGGIIRTIWQASCGAGKTWIAAEQTRLALAKGKRILHIVHRRRLVDQMIATLLRFGIHACPIMEGRMRWSSPVMCASRDTLLAMLKSGCALPAVDLIITDECHVAAHEIQKWYLANYPNCYWTGYTATPVKADGSSLNPPYQKLICHAPTSALISIGRLCQVKVFNPDAVGKRRRKGEKVKPVGDPVAHWKKYANGLPTVVFAATVADSQAICQKYIEAGITAEHIDASTPEDDRDAVFDRSEKGITKVICNVGVMVEGVDLPWLCCCQILRGCNSLVLWFQAVGRVMRTHPGKEFGIVLDHAGAAHEFGLPDADYSWELGDESDNKRKNKPPKDRKPVTCPACSFVFAGKPACPNCGKVLPMKRRKSFLDGMKPGDGILTQFTGGQNGHIKQEMFDRIFTKCFYIVRARGGPMSWTVPIFKKQSGVLPWQADLSVNIPGPGQWDIPAKEWRI